MNLNDFAHAFAEDEESSRLAMTVAVLERELEELEALACTATDEAIASAVRVQIDRAYEALDARAAEIRLQLTPRPEGAQ